MNHIEQFLSHVKTSSFESKKMTINIERILPALADNLYGSDWRVSIRELLQNAQDAVTQRIHAEEDKRIPAPTEKWTPRIRVWIDRQHSTLVIEDNGIGLTQEEIDSKIATIGECGKSLGDMAPERRRELIGQFGIGFLAAFIIGDTITVLSKSASDAEESAASAVFRGETEYQSGTVTGPVPVGTTIIVKLKTHYSDYRELERNLVDYRLLENTIRKFGDNLPSRITLHGNLNDEIGAIVNSQEAPWDKGETTREELHYYLKKRGEKFGDIAHLRRFEFTNASHGIDATGVVYFPRRDDGFDLFHDHYPNMLFVRRMYVTTGLPGLLPPWFLFAGVIVECPDLDLNLSRDRVVEHGENYVKLREHLSDFIIQASEEWTSEPTFMACYRSNLMRFTQSIVNSFLQDPKHALFRVLVPRLEFEVRCSSKPTGEQMTLEEYDEFAQHQERPGEIKTDKMVFLYLLTREDQGRLRALAVEQNYPVIYLESEIQREIINAYTSLDKSKSAMDVGSLWQESFGAKVDEEPYKKLMDLCLDSTVLMEINDVRVRSFSPAYLPAVLISVTKDQTAADAMDRFVEAGDTILPPSLTSYMQAQSALMRSSELTFTLYLNADNDLVNKLAEHIADKLEPDKLTLRIINEFVLSSALPFFEDSLLTEELMKDRAANIIELLDLHGSMLEIRQADAKMGAKGGERLGSRHVLDVTMIPAEAETRDCAVLVLDLVKPAWILGNLGIKEPGQTFQAFVEMVAAVIRKFQGHFDKFTNEGIFAEFFTEGGKAGKAAREEAAQKAFGCAMQLMVEVDGFLRKHPWRQILMEADLVGPKTRIALTWGMVKFGRYCSAGSAVGPPVVASSGMCSERKFFLPTKGRQGADIVGSANIYELIGLPMSEAPERLIKEGWRIEGLTPVDIYRLSP